MPKAITGSSEPDCRHCIILCPAFGTVGAIFTLYFINMPPVHSGIPIGRVLLCILTYFWQDVPSAAALRSGSPIFMFVFYWSAQHTLKEKVWIVLCTVKVRGMFFGCCDIFVCTLVTWWDSWQILYTNSHVCRHSGQFARLLSPDPRFLPQSKHTIAWRATPNCLSVWVKGEYPLRWPLALNSLLNFHPNRFYLPQYFVCILSLLLSSLRGVCPTKLLIDPLSQRSCYVCLSFFFAYPESGV